MESFSLVDESAISLVADATPGALESFLNESVIGLDTETYWDPALSRSRVSLVQLASPGGRVIVVDALRAGVEVVRPVIESPAVALVAHNARFDESWQRRPAPTCCMWRWWRTMRVSTNGC